MSELSVSSRPDSRPAYSIVIPAHNAVGTIGRAIESVVAQTFRAWELVVVDDGSIDETSGIVSTYAAVDARIHLIVQANLGPATARNVGSAHAHAGLIAFLDADDELMPEYLEEMDRFIGENPDYDAYHPNISVIRRDALKVPFSAVREVTSFGLRELLRECVVAVGGAIVRRELVNRLDGFRSDIHCEDYDFWLRATATGARILYLPRELYIYHQDLGGRRSEDTLAGVDDLLRSLEDLAEAHTLSPNQELMIRQAIVERRRLAARIREEQILAEQARRLRVVVEGLVGRRAAPIVMRIIHSVSWMVRPIRRAIASGRVRSR